MKLNAKFRQRLGLIIIGTLSLLILSACYSDYGMSVQDYDVVTTLYDPEYDFTKDKTYSLPDTIIHITEEGDDTKISRQYDSYILEQVNSQMQLRGFRKITDPTVELPDVAIILRAISTTTYQVYSSYYWGGYWGGWYYPWYGGTTVYSRRTTGRPGRSNRSSHSRHGGNREFCCLKDK